MKKHFTFHLDALLVLATIFLLAVVFIHYQRIQYADLLGDHAQLQWRAQDMEINVNGLKEKLKQCNESG